MIKIIDYKGHITNWRELCNELLITDSLSREERENEILIKGYKKWGYYIGNYLYGMFSFSLYDEKKDLIFCVRDQFGVKPFYYCVNNGDFLCGTSINKIINNEGFVKDVDKDVLQIYLSLSYVGGENTLFKGIKKLMPGHYLVWKDGKIFVNRYWKPKFNVNNDKTLEQWADEVHSTFETVMSEIKDEDEYVESFLSSGVDSSYVLAMSDVTNANTCGYDDSRFDESDLAKKTASILNRNISFSFISPKMYFDMVPYVMYNMEQPLGDASAIAFAIGCKEVSKNAKICYSGEGADEFFGGYNIYKNAYKYGNNLKDFYVGNTNIMNEELKVKILKDYNKEVLPIDIVKKIYNSYKKLDPLTMMCNVDIQVWLEGDIFLNVDKMSSACGLEVRAPLADRRIFDIASSIPSKYKINDEYNKVVLRTAASKVLPKEIAFRKKIGFSVPIRIWLADSRYNSDVIEKLNSDYARIFFNVDEVNKLFKEYLNGEDDKWRIIWTIYAFLVWYDEYFVKR